jgi:hypothetical protein
MTRTLRLAAATALWMLVAPAADASNTIRSSGDLADAYDRGVGAVECRYVRELVEAVDEYRDGLGSVLATLGIFSGAPVPGTEEYAPFKPEEPTTSTVLTAEVERLGREYRQKCMAAEARRMDRLVRSTASLAKTARDVERRLRATGKTGEADAWSSEAAKLECEVVRLTAKQSPIPISTATRTNALTAAGDSLRNATPTHRPTDAAETTVDPSSKATSNENRVLGAVSVSKPVDTANEGCLERQGSLKPLTAESKNGSGMDSRAPLTVSLMTGLLAAAALAYFVRRSRRE